MKKTVFALFALLVFPTLIWSQTNLLDTSSWNVGNGSAPGFSAYGSSPENVRALGMSPYGNQEILWIGIPDGASNPQVGGWSTDYIPIDNTKTYRFTVWMKKKNSFEGGEVFKTFIYESNSINVSLRLDGSFSTNPIFQASDVPMLDKWYLYVGFVHDVNFSGTSDLGGVYDPVDGSMVMGATDYKFASTAVSVRHLAQFYGSSNSADSLELFGPTLYEVNGQEPTLAEIINPGGGEGSGQTVWNSSGNDINYTAGNVGIGTTAIGTWKLAVGGKIRAEEVKVETGWADYVFTEGYDLPTMEEVEKHIQENGHLINIPSAAEVKANGIEIGHMNKLLLEKIEELTLYILKMDKEIQALKNIKQPKTQGMKCSH